MDKRDACIQAMADYVADMARRGMDKQECELTLNYAVQSVMHQF